MDFMRSLLFKKPRLTGLLFFLGGIISAFHLMEVYREGSSVFSKDISYTPGLLIYGLSVMIEPRILEVWKPNNEQEVPGKYKVASILVIVIAAGIGLYLSLVVFKDWKPVVR
jgi:hypothetical protein